MTRSKPTPRILLLVKNGIGYGHIRRALLIANELRDLGADPVVISQASSLRIFDEQTVKVVNFPLLHRVPSSAAELAYADLLDRVVGKLRPELVVDDTYPDRRYLQLPSLREVPRLLVARRIEPIAFDQMRRDGSFAPYSSILLAQNEEDFSAEPHSMWSRRAVELSGRFLFTGGIHHEPGPSELTEVRRRYGHQAPLIVVNAGAGGDQVDDAFTDTFFKTAAATARRCLERGIPAHFVAALGPYYGGHELPRLPNLTYVSWEPRLSALLRIASVAVLQPGHNVVSEALAGAARLVLVPGESWMEGQHEMADRMAAAHQARVSPIGDAEALTTQVLAALDDGPREPQPLRHPSGAHRAAQQILAETHRSRRNTPVPIRRLAVCLLVSPPDGLSPSSLVELLGRAGLADAVVVGARSDDSHGVEGLPVAGPVERISALPPGGRSSDPARSSMQALLVDAGPPASLTPAALASGGVRLLLDEGPSRSGGHLRGWLAHHGDSNGILNATVYPYLADADRPDRLLRRIALLLRNQTTVVIHIDLAGLRRPAVARYSAYVAQALRDNAVELITPATCLQRLAQAHLLGEGD